MYKGRFSDPHICSQDGDKVLRLDNKLVYTDYEKNIGISKIVVADVNDDYTVTQKIDWFSNVDIVEDYTYEEQSRFIKDVFGEESFKEYTNRDFQATERFDRPTKRGKSRSTSYFASKQQNRARVYIKDGEIVDNRKSIKVDSPGKELTNTTLQNWRVFNPKD